MTKVETELLLHRSPISVRIMNNNTYIEPVDIHRCVWTWFPRYPMFMYGRDSMCVRTRVYVCVCVCIYVCASMYVYVCMCDYASRGGWR